MLINNEMGRAVGDTNSVPAARRRRKDEETPAGPIQAAANSGQVSGPATATTLSGQLHVAPSLLGNEHGDPVTRIVAA